MGELVDRPRLLLRDDVRGTDPARVREMVEATTFFRPGEVDVAVELVQERLAKGKASGYLFLFAEEPGGRVLGYTCYGEIACTLGSWDLYWIVVAPTAQGLGIGRRLLVETERRIAAAGGRRLYIETSGRPDYAPTRAFYRALGYERVALLPDFYAPGDPKEIYACPVGPRKT